MQTIVNKTLKKNAKYATGKFGASDDEESEIDDEAKTKRRIANGFMLDFKEILKIMKQLI